MVMVHLSKLLKKLPHVAKFIKMSLFADWYYSNVWKCIYAEWKKYKEDIGNVNCNQLGIQDRIQIGPMGSQIQPSMEIIPTRLQESGINTLPTFVDNGLKSVIPFINQSPTVLVSTLYLP